MIHHFLSRFLIAVLLIAGAGQVPAQDKDKEAQSDPLSKYIVEMFNTHQGKTLCSLGNVPVAAIRGAVIEQLKANGAGEAATPLQVDVALWTRFPCPFSPYRAETLAATVKDVEGVWLFPEESQPYRFGPRSERQPAARAQAITCEAVAYYPGGELRTGAIVGTKVCPFRKAADLDPARKRPPVANWSMLADGRLKVTRTDVKDHVEEWDVYAVTRTFQALNMEIKAGDLIAYLRRDKDNDVNATTEFRHLQPLK